MVEFRIYIEGGGNNDATRTALRNGFGEFLKPLRELAHKNGVKKWQIIASGSRREAYDDFCAALKTYPNAFVALLVDAEDSMPDKCTDPTRRNWEHLAKRQGDQWACPGDVDDSQCFLMIACMEAWLIADRDAIAAYYGKNFSANALPKNTNLESVPKNTIEDAMKAATKSTQKGGYHKTKHAFDILRQVNPETVRSALSECNRLFVSLEDRINAPAE